MSRKQNFELKLIKSPEEILKEKADDAEKYLQKLGQSMLILRNQPADLNLLNTSSSSQITDSSSADKKRKVTKSKVKKIQKKVVSDIKQLTLDLMSLEAELDKKDSKKKRNSFRKSDKQKLMVEDVEPQAPKCSHLSPIKFFKAETVHDECEDYYKNFKNYKIRQQVEISGKQKQNLFVFTN